MRTLRISIATLLLASSASAQRASRPASTDPWEVTELTNRPSLTLELPALNTVRAARAAAFEVRPVLLVRCQDRELDVFVATGSVLDSDDNVMTPVRLQWGSEAPAEHRWSRSTDSTSAFAPDPRALLRQLVLRRPGLQGRVTVQAVIDTLGRAEPASLKVIARPNTAFDQSARAFVLHAVFRPARVKGRAVRVLITVPVDYRIE